MTRKLRTRGSDNVLIDLGFNDAEELSAKTIVCIENLNPNVMVMKSAKDGVRFDASGPLNWARDRGIFIQ